jgi:hypothetical protein
MPACGVVVEKFLWATGKHTLCDGFRLFLAQWARKLSWDEVALSFHVSWADVCLGAMGGRLRAHGAAPFQGALLSQHPAAAHDVLRLASKLGAWERTLYRETVLRGWGGRT